MRGMNPRWRTLTEDDAHALAELSEAADQIGENKSAKDIAEEFDSPAMDAQDGLG
jgi:hypothetical protein